MVVSLLALFAGAAILIALGPDTAQLTPQLGALLGGSGLGGGIATIYLRVRSGYV